MIRPAMQAWYDVTKKLVELTNSTSEDQRDEVIEGINSRLDERDKLQSHISAPFTSEEQFFSKELLALESEVQKRLAAFSAKIRLDITDAQAKKDNMKSYVNPYGNMGQDGAYYDTKQ